MRAPLTRVLIFLPRHSLAEFHRLEQLVLAAHAYIGGVRVIAPHLSRDPWNLRDERNFPRDLIRRLAAYVTDDNLVSQISVLPFVVVGVVRVIGHIDDCSFQLHAKLGIGIDVSRETFLGSLPFVIVKIDVGILT